MANYESTYRTNYFRVTDEEKWKELFCQLSGEDLYDLSEIKDGVMCHAFGGSGYILYNVNENEDYEEDIGNFFEELSKILPKDEAVIYTEVGNEKLYVNAYSIITTHKGIKSINLEDAAMELAKKSLEKNDYTTQMCY